MCVCFLNLNNKSTCLGTSSSPGSIVVEKWPARVGFVTPGFEPWAIGLCTRTNPQGLVTTCYDCAKTEVGEMVGSWGYQNVT